MQTTAYIYYHLIINDRNFDDDLNKVKIVLNKQKAAGFKINAKKCISTEKTDIRYNAFTR